MSLDYGTASIYDRNKAARGVTLYLSAVQFTKFIEYQGAVDVSAVPDVEDDGLELQADLIIDDVSNSSSSNADSYSGIDGDIPFW